jgi:hypothetical protein
MHEVESGSGAVARITVIADHLIPVLLVHDLPRRILAYWDVREGLAHRVHDDPGSNGEWWRAWKGITVGIGAREQAELLADLAAEYARTGRVRFP